MEYRLAPPLWWRGRRDGWPQLLVPADPGNVTTEPLVCAFSAGTGEMTRKGSGLIEFQATDADGDGIEDLFALANDSTNGSTPAERGLLSGPEAGVVESNRRPVVGDDRPGRRRHGAT